MKLINSKIGFTIIVLMINIFSSQSQTVKQIGKDLFYIEQWHRFGKIDSNSVYKNMNLWDLPYEIMVKLSDSSWMDTALMYFPIKFTFGNSPNLDDTMYAGWASRALGITHEPKIYDNDKLGGNDILRLAYFNFTFPEIYRVEKKGKNIKLYYKVLNGSLINYNFNPLINVLFKPIVNDSIDITEKEWKNMQKLFIGYLRNISFHRETGIPNLILESYQNGNYNFLFTERFEQMNFNDIRLLLDYLRKFVEKNCVKTNKLEQAEMFKKLLSIGNNVDY